MLYFVCNSNCLLSSPRHKLAILSFVNAQGAQVKQICPLYFVMPKAQVKLNSPCVFCQVHGTSSFPIVFCQAQGTSWANLPIMFCQTQGTSYANLPIVFCQAQGTSQANLLIVSSSPIKAQVKLICPLSFVWPKAHVSKAILPIVKSMAHNTEAWANSYVLLHRLVTNSITMKIYYLLKQK